MERDGRIKYFLVIVIPIHTRTITPTHAMLYDYVNHRSSEVPKEEPNGRFEGSIKCIFLGSLPSFGHGPHWNPNAPPPWRYEHWKYTQWAMDCYFISISSFSANTVLYFVYFSWKAESQVNTLSIRIIICSFLAYYKVCNFSMEASDIEGWSVQIEFCTRLSVPQYYPLALV